MDEARQLDAKDSHSLRTSAFRQLAQIIFRAERSYLLAVPAPAAVGRAATRTAVRCDNSVLRIVELDRHDGGCFAAPQRSQLDLFPVLSLVMGVEQCSAASSHPYMIADNRHGTE